MLPHNAQEVKRPDVWEIINMIFGVNNLSVAHKYHVGLYCNEVLNNKSFYKGILVIKELWRCPESQMLCNGL